jgi:ubiquinone/menaquinone biosynthesis C-methylase UbiE
VIAARRDSLIHCPKCGRGFLALPSEPTQVLRCGVCAAVYPVAHGVIDLLPGGTATRGLAQRALESERVVDFYESRWWRRSLLAAFALGISFEQEHERISRIAKVQRGETVLDLGCGTGLYTRPFAQRARPGLVVGLDSSLAMLRAAAQRARQHTLSNVVLIRGTAVRLPFPSARFDVVNCCGALHLFPNPGRVLREIHRVLKPGGRFTAATSRWNRGPLAGWTANAIANMLGIHPFSRSELEARCHRAGLEEVTFHYASRLWFLMGARRPAETS